jgi:hypothetical protein
VRSWNSLKDYKDILTTNGSSYGQNLALTVSYVPYTLDHEHLPEQLRPPLHHPGAHGTILLAFITFTNSPIVWSNLTSENHFF